MIPAANVGDVQYSASPVDRVLAFHCACGCDLFRIEVSTYLNGDWSEEVICAGCGRQNAVTEPIVNGPH